MQVEYNNKVLTKDIDYTVTYSNNIKAGQAICTIKPQNNSFTGTIYKTYTISPLAPSKIEIIKQKDNSIKYEWIPSSNDNILGYVCDIYVKDTTGNWKGCHQIKAYRQGLTSLRMPSEIKFNNGTQYRMVFYNRLFYSNNKADMLNSTVKTKSVIEFDPAKYNVDLSVNKTTAVAGEGITLKAKPTSEMNNVEYAFLYRPKGTTQWIVYRNYEESNTCVFRLSQSSIGTSSKSYEFLVKAKSKIETNGDENTTNGLVVTDIRVGDDAIDINPNTTKPEVRITENPSSWTNQTVNLKINVSDSSGAGIKKVIANGKEEIPLTNGSAVYTVNAYGQYSFEAINYAENSTTANVTVKIDKEKPTSNKPSAKATANTIVATAEQTDEMSGIKLLEYSIYKGNTWGEWQKSNTFSGLNVGTTYKIKTKATDNAGNYSESEELVIKTMPDEIQPELRVLGNPEEWTNKDVTLTIEASDAESGLKNVTVNGQEVNITSGQGVYVAKENGTYRIEATDNVGNIKAKEVVIDKIDKIQPELKVSGNTEGWTNRDVTLTIQASDAESGLKDVKVNGQEVNITSGQGTYLVNSNGTYRIEATDNVGNIKIEEVVVDKIDKIRPELKVSGNPEEWTNRDVTLTIQASDAESGLKDVKVNGQEVNITSGQGAYVVKENGTYKIEVTDNAGSIITEMIEVDKIDKILPSTTEPEVVVTENSIIVKNKQEDKESGIQKISYAINQEGEWSEYQDSNMFEGLEKGKEYKVKTRVMDNAGNISESEERIVKILEVVSGDINNDKKIDTMDLLKLLRYVTMQRTGKNKDKWDLTDKEKMAADINKDGKINTIDILKMKRYLAANKDAGIAQEHPDWLDI